MSKPPPTGPRALLGQPGCRPIPTEPRSQRKPKPPSPPPLPPPPPSEPPPPPPVTGSGISFSLKPRRPSTSTLLPPPPATAPPPPPPPPPPSPPPQTESWPPPRSAYPTMRSFKVIWEPGSRRDDYFRALVEAIQATSSASTIQDRIKDKGKGKEVLIRYEGEIMEGGRWTGRGSTPPPDDELADFVVKNGATWVRERRPQASDPRKTSTFKRRPPRQDFYELAYPYDAHSYGPPPPTTVLVANIPPLTPNTTIRRHFSSHGVIQHFEPQIDKENGGALGIVAIRYTTHEEAKQAAEKENGRLNVFPSPAGSWELKAVLDGDGSRLKAILKLLDERKRLKKKPPQPSPVVPSPSLPTPLTHALPPKPNIVPTPRPAAPPATLPPKPASIHVPAERPNPLDAHAQLSAQPMNGSMKKTSVNSQWKARQVDRRDDRRERRDRSRSRSRGRSRSRSHGRRSRSRSRERRSRSRGRGRTRSRSTSRRDRSRSRPRRDRSGSRSWDRRHSRSRDRRRYRSHSRSRDIPSTRRTPSPSPLLRLPSTSTPLLSQNQALLILSKSPLDYIQVECDPYFVRSVPEDEIYKYFVNFSIDKILKSTQGLYVTFIEKPKDHRSSRFSMDNPAQRAEVVLKDQRLWMTSVRLIVVSRETTLRTVKALGLDKQDDKKQDQDTIVQGRTWTPEQLVDVARQRIIKELKELLEKDVKDRIIFPEVSRIVGKVAESKTQINGTHLNGTGTKAGSGLGLKGLKMRKKGVITATKVEEDYRKEEERENGDSEVERPLKKKKSLKVEDEADDETPPPISTLSLHFSSPTKRAIDEQEDDDMEDVVLPPKKRRKERKAKPVARVKPATKTKAKAKIVEIESEDEEVSTPLAPVLESPSLSPSPPPRPPSPRIPISEVCDDDEDMWFARMVLTGNVPPEDEPKSKDPSSDPPADTPRVHVTGSARTEGFYKISLAEKSTYVTQYQSRIASSTATANATPTPSEEPSKPVISSRSNRANARRRAQGLEEISQVQRAVALSKGESLSSGSAISLSANQLQSRKKHLRFARSPIHDWGLYAMERISRGEMVIEYVGEIIRAQVAEKREKFYERQGIGSSYLFRIDEDLVVDATKKGNLGRLINHSCDPNCTAKIITVGGEKKIVIYAKTDIEWGDEITYDYHFPFEQDKIPCLCGSVKCRGFLN